MAMSAWTQKHYPKTRRPEAVDLISRGPKSLKQLEVRLRREHGIA